MKFTSKNTLLLLSLLVSGSSWPAPTVQQVAGAEVRAVPTRLTQVSGVLTSDVRLGAKALVAARPTPATDFWLFLFLGGAVIALQLRRTQRSIRVARVVAA